MRGSGLTNKPHMTIDDIAALRLYFQQVSNHTSLNCSNMVESMVVLQAQDHAGAKWSAGLRVPGATDAGVEQAIADRELVRTWSLRGTLHFMHPADVRWILQLVAPRVLNTAGTIFRRFGLDKAGVIENSHKVLRRTLAGTGLTRGQLAEAFKNADIDSSGQRMGLLLLQASLTGVICHGPRIGKEFTFVLLDEWLPGAPPRMTRDEAVAALMERYFASHGPATLADFAYWAGLTATDAKLAMEKVGKHLHSAEAAGTVYWMSRKIPEHYEAGGVHLLPGFDELLLGYKDRSPTLHPDHAQRIIPSGNGLFLPAIIINSKVAGIWKRTMKKEQVIIDLMPFEKQPETVWTQMEQAAEQYAHFAGLTADINRNQPTGR